METVETINLVDEYNKLKAENNRLREENYDLTLTFLLSKEKAADEIGRLIEVSQQQLDAAYRNGYDTAYAIGYSEGLKETLDDGMPLRDDRPALERTPE